MTRIAGTGTSNRIFQGQRKDFIVMRKDTFEYTGTYTYVDTDNTELQYDFTNCIGMMAIKKKKTDTTPVRVASVSFDEEEYTLAIDAEDMDMDAGRYYYDMQIYDADGHMVTKLYGDFVVLQDVTDFLETIEEDYEYMFGSNVETAAVPQEKFTLVIASSVLIEIVANLSEYYTNMLRSSVTTSNVLRYIMSAVFSSSVSAELVNKYTTIAMFGSSVTITTYVNQDYTIMLGSTVSLLKYTSSTEEWVPIFVGT